MNIKDARVTTAILAYPGVVAASLSCALDDLAPVGVRGPYFGQPAGPQGFAFKCRIVGPQLQPVASASGRPIWPHVSITAESPWDLVFVPTLSSPENLLHRDDAEIERVCVWLKQCYSNGSVIASVAGGAALLIRAEILDEGDMPAGYRFQDNWYSADDTDRRHAIGVYGDDERLVTTAATLAGHNDLTAYLIQRFCGKETLSSFMDHRGPHWAGHAREGDSALSEVRAVSDAGVRAALRWLDQNLSAERPVLGMASTSGLTTRTLTRRFKKSLGQTPADYVRLLRIERAQQLLTTTDLAIADIARSVGYADLAAFRNAFRQQAGLTPSAYRRTYVSIAK